MFGTSYSVLFPLVPFTIFSPINFNTLYSSSVAGVISNNWGLLAIKLVSHSPLLNVSSFNTLIKKSTFVFTPVIVNSLIERIAFLLASSNVLE